MHVLLIKTSSLGDVLHTLPALTDAAEAIPGIRFDWVVEEAFAEIPEWHPAVDRVIKVAIRRWRRSPFKAMRSGEWFAFRNKLKEREYDLVLDAQGLIKSALMARMVRRNTVGLDAKSARESLASRLYDQSIFVQKGEHATIRLRKLFARALRYEIVNSVPVSGIGTIGKKDQGASRIILFVHGTTWSNKHWPNSYWMQLAKIANNDGYMILLPWGNRAEKQRAEKIASKYDSEVLPKLSLNKLSEQFNRASMAVCVDSGLAHLVAALEIPSISIYGPTTSTMTGTMGDNQLHANSEFECAPCQKRECAYRKKSIVEPACLEQITPELVWKQLTNNLI